MSASPGSPRCSRRNVQPSITGIRKSSRMTHAAPQAGPLAAAASPAATVLYDDRSVALDRIGPDPTHAADALWVRKRDLPRINDFEVKPQGACRADLCIPIPKNMLRGEYFNL